MFSCNSSYVFSFILLNYSFICGMVEYIQHSANSNKWLTGICQRKNLLIVSRKMGDDWWCWTILQSVPITHQNCQFDTWPWPVVFHADFCENSYCCRNPILHISTLNVPRQSVDYSRNPRMTKIEPEYIYTKCDLTKGRLFQKPEDDKDRTRIYINKVRPKQSVDYSRHPRMTKIEPEYI